MGDDGETEYQSPFGVTADEEAPDGFVRVQVVLPGLRKKLIKNEPSNGSVDLKLEARSLVLTVTMDAKDSKKKKAEKYQYCVKQLPDTILIDKSYHKIVKDQVQIFLCKEKSRSWARELAENGLETEAE